MRRCLSTILTRRNELDVLLSRPTFMDEGVKMVILCWLWLLWCCLCVLIIMVCVGRKANFTGRAGCCP